jgi:hypothetical protein
MIFVKLKEKVLLSASLQSSKPERKRFSNREIEDTYSFDKGDIFYYNAAKKRYYLILSAETEPIKFGFRLTVRDSKKIASYMEPANIYIPTSFMSVYGDMRVLYKGKKTTNISGIHETILEYEVSNKKEGVKTLKVPLLDIQYFFNELTYQWEGTINSVLNKDFKSIVIGKTEIVAGEKHYLPSRCTIDNGIVTVKFKEIEKVKLNTRIPKNSVITKEEYSKLTNSVEEIDNTPKGLAVVCKNAISASRERYKTSFNKLPLDAQIKALKINILKHQTALLKDTITKEELASLTADYVLLTRLKEWEK